RATEIHRLPRSTISAPAAPYSPTARAAALLASALARRYARRDIFQDLRAGYVVGLAVVALFVFSALIPERYADAREWAASARGSVRSEPRPAAAFAEAGLTTSSVEPRTKMSVRTGPASATVGSVTVQELFPQPEVLPRDFDSNATPSPIHLRSVVSEGLGGGGVVDGPLVFAARGVVPAEIPHPLAYAAARRLPDLATLVKDYPDDYAGIDVRGKIVLLVRFMGVDTETRGVVEGFSVGTAVNDAIK